MQEELVSFETAKLAKEKGLLDSFESCLNKTEYVSAFYSEDGVSFEETEFQLQDCAIQDRYYRPTQSLLQKWLREEHNIHFEIKPIFDVTDNLKPYHINVIKNPSGKGFEYRIVGAFDTYEEALEIALQESLKLIK